MAIGLHPSFAVEQELWYKVDAAMEVLGILPLAHSALMKLPAANSNVLRWRAPLFVRNVRTETFYCWMSRLARLTLQQGKIVLMRC